MLGHNPLFKKLKAIFLLGLVVMLTNSCETADEILSNALNFEGVYHTTDGWEITLEEDGDKVGTATITKVGTPRSSVTFKGGESAGFSLKPIGDNTWQGYVWDETFRTLYADSKVQINGNTLTIMPNGAAAYSFTAGPASGNGTGTGTGTGSGGQVIIDKVVNGNKYDKLYTRFTLPAGVKKMTVLATEGTDPNVYYYNLADMFVSKGTDPTVSTANGYNWTADCPSVESNRADELCTFNNPGAGQWSVMLYGYNSSFATKLVVTIYQ